MEESQGRIIHLSTSIEGLLHHYKRKKITFLTDDDGRRISDSDAPSSTHEMFVAGKDAPVMFVVEGDAPVCAFVTLKSFPSPHPTNKVVVPAEA